MKTPGLRFQVGEGTAATLVSIFHTLVSTEGPFGVRRWDTVSIFASSSLNQQIANMEMEKLEFKPDCNITASDK